MWLHTRQFSREEHGLVIADKQRATTSGAYLAVTLWAEPILTPTTLTLAYLEQPSKHPERFGVPTPPGERTAMCFTNGTQFALPERKLVSSRNHHISIDRP